MWFKNLIRNLFADSEATESADINADAYEQIAIDVYVREMAFWSCVNTVANAVSKCEFKTFMNGEEVQGDEHYLWNYSPNINQSSSVFLNKLIAKLYKDNEALVITQGDQLLVADSFGHTEYAKYDDRFDSVGYGEFSFNKKFTQSDVLYFKLNFKNMRAVSNGIYSAYKKLIDYSMKNYQTSRGNKGILNITAKASGADNFEERFKELMNKQFSDFFKKDNTVLPLFEGFEYQDIGSKTYSAEGTRDIRAMIDDVSDFTARAFGIPPALLNGKVEGTDQAMDSFLTFCIDPLCDMLQEEINRKRYGKEGIRNGCYLKIDTSCIRHVDLLSVSESVDKLIASGAFSINDIRQLTGNTKINAGWADEHFITKNYTDMNSMNSLERGIDE